MSKYKINKIFILSLIVLCLAGCQDNKNNVVSNEKQEYENLIYTNDFYIEQTDINNIQTFEMTIKPSLSMQELYDLFDETVEKYYPNVFSAEEKELLYDVNGTDQNGNQLPRAEYDENDNIIVGGYARNKEALLKGEYPTPWLWFTSDKGMIQMYPNGSLQSVTCDKAYKLDNPDGNSVAMYCAADSNEIIDRIHIPVQNFNSNISYKLLDKEFSLADAILVTEELLQDADKGVANENFVADVTDAWIVDMGNDIYGYHFWLTSTYNGIRLDTSPMKQALISEIDDTNCNHSYDLYPGYAFMIESNKLDSIMAYGFRRAYQIDNIQQQEKIISYEEAEQKLSDSISANSKIEISRAEFVYTPYFENEERKNDHIFVDSAWKFVAKNQNDGYDYIFYVDSLSGEVEYYKY